MAASKHKQRTTPAIASEPITVALHIEDGPRTSDWDALWRQLLLRPRQEADAPHLAPAAPAPEEEETETP